MTEESPLPYNLDALEVQTRSATAALSALAASGTGEEAHALASAFAGIAAAVRSREARARAAASAADGERAALRARAAALEGALLAGDAALRRAEALAAARALELEAVTARGQALRVRLADAAAGVEAEVLEHERCGEVIVFA